MLANETRLRLLHALVRQPGLAVTHLARVVGMKPQAVSNQLQRLAGGGIVLGLRDGTSIHYHVHDPCVLDLIDRCWCLVEETKERNRQLENVSPIPERASRAT